MADESIISYSDLIGKDGTFEEISDNIKQIEADLISLAKTAKKAFASVSPSDAAGIEKLEKQVKELAQAEKNLIKIKETANKARKKNIQLTQEELIQREAEKVANRERVQRAKQLAIIRREEKNNIASLRAQLSLVTLDWKKLTAEELKNTKEGQKLVNSKKQLTAQLKKLEKATGDNRREVGNYTQATKGLRRGLMRLFVGRTIIDGVLRLGGALGDIVEKGKDNNKSFAALSDSFTILKQNLTTVATVFLNFIAGPLTGFFNGLSFIVSKLVDFGSSVFNTAKAILDWGRSFEFVNRIVTTFTDILFNIPAVFSGIIAAAKDFTFTTINLFRRFRKQISILALEIEKVNPFGSRRTTEIQRDINVLLAEQTAIINETVGVQKAFNDAFDASLTAQAEFAAEQEVILDNTNKQVDAENEKTAAIERQAQRLKALAELQKQVAAAEADNIEDAQARALRLEELRFEAENALRVENFEKLKALTIEQEGDLSEIESLNQRLSEEQLKDHLENKLNIREEYAIQTQDIEAINVLDNNDELQAVLNEEVELIEDSNKKIEDSSKELLESISGTAKKVSEIITELFEKQADLSEERVEQQSDNLDRARDRAERGLEANIAFEEAELAKREADQQRRQKEAEQAAKLLTLFNLVAAYAGNGDENALFRGLADFALLEAFSAGLSGFYEGTEDTGTSANPLDSKGGRLAILHDNERVMTKIQNMALGGMSNDEVVQNALIGEAMSDNYNPQSITTQSLFKKQKEEFANSMKKSVQSVDTNSAIVRELRTIKTQLSKQPNVGLEIEKVYNNVYDIIKTEIKTHMKKSGKKRLR